MSSTSTFNTFEEYDVADAQKKIEGHSKMSDGYHKLSEALLTMPKNLMLRTLH